MRRVAFFMVATSLSVGLTACNQSSTADLNAISQKQKSPQSQMLHIAKRMQACWFGRKKDPAFKRYKMAAELDSYSGKPRVLIVPKNNPRGLPKLVVQSERIGGRNSLTSFGPLLQTSSGGRIQTQVRRWGRGQNACA